MKVAMTEVEFERRQAWSSCAGEIGGLRRGVALLERKAESEFTARRDANATLLRELADELRKHLDVETTMWRL